MLLNETIKEVTSFEDVDTALLQIGKAESIRAKKEAQMNDKIQNIRAKFEEDTIVERDVISSLELKIQDFCSKNKKEFETDKRSKVLVHGSVGFRTNPPKVLQLSNKFKIATTLEFIKKLWGKQKDLYIRTKEELNKDAILSAYVAKDKAKDMKNDELKGKLTDEMLATVGLRIDADETFNYEIKWEELSSDAVA